VKPPVARPPGSCKRRTYPEKKAQALIADRNYAALDQLVLEHLMGKWFRKRDVIGVWATVLPHPSPLPLGEGEPFDRFKKCVRLDLPDSRWQIRDVQS
jgi:hypothetical protein